MNGIWDPRPLNTVDISGFVTNYFPDGDFFTIDFSTGDTFAVELHDIKHSVCTALTGKDTTFIFVADTTPAIQFKVEGDTVACMGDEVRLYATETGGAAFNVAFNWHHPSNLLGDTEIWKLDTVWDSIRLDTALLTAPVFIGAVSRVDTIRVYASGGCGTSNVPVLFPVRIESTPEFTDLIPYADYTYMWADTVCQDSTLTVKIDTTGKGYTITEIRWNYPGAIDTLGDTAVTFTVPADTCKVYARFKIEGYCGFSHFNENSVAIVNIHNQPKAPKKENLYPCDVSELGYLVTDDKRWTDSIAWQLLGIAPGFEETVDTLTAGYAINDSIHFENVGNTDFQLVATAFNACGWREDTISVFPIDKPDNFVASSVSMAMFKDPMLIRNCFGDTIVGWIEVPDNHIDIKPVYHWTIKNQDELLPSEDPLAPLEFADADWQIVRVDSLDVDNKRAMLMFIPGRDSVLIGVYAEYCGNTDTVATYDIGSVQIHVSATASEYELGYGDNVELYVHPDSLWIEGEDLGDIRDSFDYEWMPDYRFDIGAADTAVLIWAYLGKEEFYLRIVEKDTTLPYQCSARDTVYLTVSNSYSITADVSSDTVCEGSSFSLSSMSSGGEPNYYSQTWYMKDPISGEYTELTKDQNAYDETHVGRDSLQCYRIVGVDSMYGGPGRRPEDLMAVYDTFDLCVQVVAPIEAKIAYMQTVQVVDKVLEDRAVLHEFDKPVKLGDRLRFFGEVEGNGRDSAYTYVYEWWQEDQEDITAIYPEYPTAFAEDLAGYVLGEDEAVSVSGLIFRPQTFYFYVADPAIPGCYSETSVFVEVVEVTGDKDDFGPIPGGFSPRNGDGINDVFMPTVDELKILNRWGVVVYESTDKKGWNGTDRTNNRFVEAGDYFYILKMRSKSDKNKLSIKTGVVTVF